MLRRIRFRHRRLAHEGSDWLLRAIGDGVGVEFVATPEPLVIFHAEEARERMSNANDWRASLAWADANAELLTAHAYAAFVLIRASIEARRGRDSSAFWRLAQAAFRRGRPTAVGFLAHVLIWLVPRRARFSIAERLERWLPRPVTTR